ncbi:MAG: succinate dehydrogenase, hydrophobic membrane anchor protein [Gammaproteobacteria bacterium]|nr:succinate dehydrogenase, hydrophobic membrane anchor protein [Gammaproteobacteria bacterium]HAH67724.1 succinate dehydrogenase, hydrophobic membrane anchor protein [Gammaproteobacteria bacterium]|tara:strand:- start:77 stop:448 length:372 start_codon:yes stop_codon:yes gene_type:complete
MGVILKIRRLFGLAGFEHDSDHWKSQRSSAIALFILGYWMVYQLLFFLNQASVPEIQQWIAEPLNSMLLALTVLYTFYHSELGLQVITEDYVESKSKQITILYIVRVIRLSLITLTIISLMRI